MKYATTCALSVLGLMLVATTLHAQALSRYRDYQLGSTLQTVATTSGVAPEDVKVIHQRPAIIQELRWRPQVHSARTVQADPVREVMFSFYNDQLFQVVVDYDRQRTEGLTDADLVEAIAGIYGPPLLAAINLPAGPPTREPENDKVVARWAGTESSLTLLRGTYPTSLQLVLALTRVRDLAETAAAEAIRQDLKEAPQRERDRVTKAAEDGRIAGEKARTANKPAFKP